MNRQTLRPARTQQRLVALLLLFLVTSTGCSRAFWRDQADRDVYQAITERLNDPRWAIPRLDVTPDPRSRFFDPFDPDTPPLPPDDPAANIYMHWVDGWHGYDGWHKFGQSFSIENPDWLANFGITPDMVDPLTGGFMGSVPELEEITLDEAIELSLIHSREYQTEIENVYLAALDVTFDRFQFNVRYLDIGNSEPSAGVTSATVPHGSGDSVVLGAAAGVSQVLPFGTQWAVELANNTLWLFSGGGQTSSASVLSYSIVQPLLLGAGRRVGLENLTLSERALLYQVRELSQFRREFFTSVVGGGSGYLGLLQQLQAIRNEQDNISRLQEQVDRLQAEAARNTRFAGADLLELPANLQFPPEIAAQIEFRDDLKRLLWRGPMTAQQEEILRNLSPDPGFNVAIATIIQSVRTEVTTLDVLQLQSSLANSINRLRGLERNFQDTLDEFKILLGLPPTMAVGIDDSLLKPFELIDPSLTDLEVEAQEFIEVWAQISDEDPQLDQVRETARLLQLLISDVENRGLASVVADLESVEARVDDRLRSLEEPEYRERVQSDLTRARTLLNEARESLGTVVQAANQLTQSLEVEQLPLEARIESYEHLNTLREDLLRIVRNLFVVQISLRVELIDTQDYDLTIEESVALGLANRVDLMNAKAEVMDARRRLEVAANRLQAALDLVVEGDVRNSGGNRPFDFRGDRSELRAGIRFTAPLDQIAERNNYRAALIEYQRARRAYIAFEDNVRQAIRRDWRQLNVLRRNLETSRIAVRIAALQYDSAVNETSAPVDPRQSVASQGRSGLQGNNLLQALSSILQAQNQLISNWIDYERNRLNIHRDMGIMDIAPDGIWDDPLYRNLNNELDLQPERIVDPNSGRADRDVGRRGSSNRGGHAETGVVELARFERESEERESDHGDRYPWAVPDQSDGAGAPR